MDCLYDFYVCHVFDSVDAELMVSAKAKLEEEDYNRFLISKSNVTSFWSSQHVVRSVLENRNDIIKSIVMLSKSFLDESEDREEIIHYGHFNLSRLFANLCGMFRSFLDHYDGHFIRFYGKDSDEYALWKSTLSNEFDGHDGYKIVSMIRNYIQHYDMPPIALSVSKHAGEDVISLKVDIELRELMKDAKFRGKFINSGLKYENQLPLLKVIDEWDGCFKRIVEIANTIRIKECIVSAREILEIRNRFDIDHSGKIALLKLPKFDDKPDKLTLNLNWLPELLAQEIVN